VRERALARRSGAAPTHHRRVGIVRDRWRDYASTMRVAVLLPLVLLALGAGPALAEGHGPHERGHRLERNGWHDHDIHRFREHDLERWRSGAWYHTRHGGRFGWWWVVGGLWYFYPAPVYPYPNPYEPPIGSVPPPPRVYYYCDNPPGYYPYVPECRTPWRTVPSQ
jgi:hypothetical protein